MFLRQLRYNYESLIVSSTEDRFVEVPVVEYRWYKPKGRDSSHFRAWHFSWEKCRLVSKQWFFILSRLEVQRMLLHIALFDEDSLYSKSVDFI